MQTDLSKETTMVHDVFTDDLFWFFANGTTHPKSNEISEEREIWPEQVDGNDRIVQQLMYIPKKYEAEKTSLKQILLWHGLNRWVKPGQRSFLEAKCPVNRCTITDDHSRAPNADAILFKSHFILPQFRRPLNQVISTIIITNSSTYILQLK